MTTSVSVARHTAECTKSVGFRPSNSTNWRKGLATVGVGLVTMAPISYTQRPPSPAATTESTQSSSTGLRSNAVASLNLDGRADPGPKSAASDAIEDLKDWLQLNDSELSTLTGISRRSITNWRSGASAYGATTRNLFGLHALIGSLRTHLDEAGTLLWLVASQFEGHLSALELLADDPEQLSTVVTKALPLILPTELQPRVEHFDEEHEQRLLAELRSDARPAGRRPVNRPRNASRHG